MPEFTNGGCPPARRVYLFAGCAGLAGCLSAIAGDLITVALRGNISFIENSISRAAVGDYAIVTDVGISVLALGVAAIAWALFDWKLGARPYSTGALLLAMCAVAIFLLAAWNGYDRKSADDFGFHMNLVYLLAGLFPLAAWLVAGGLDAIHRNWKRFSRAVAVLWVLSGPLYFLTPDDLKGLFERATLMLLLLWVAAISVLMIQRALKDAAPA